MAIRGFDRETLMELSVNIVPLFIILFFSVVLLTSNRFDWELFVTVLTHGLLVVPFVLLALVTYVAARKMSSN